MVSLQKRTKTIKNFQLKNLNDERFPPIEIKHTKIHAKIAITSSPNGK